MEQQQQLLREIRDAVLSTRSSSMGMSAGAGGGEAGAHGPARPGGAYVNATVQYDRMLAGDWANFGWANAYRSAMKSSLTSDAAAYFGLGRAPETLFQNEYQALAGQSLGLRLTSGVGSMMAPQFTSRVNAMSEDIFANSARFIRFGNPGAGPIGAGMNFGAANDIALAVQKMALSDLRLSPGDYTSITSVGMRTGQYDFSQNQNDFVAKTRELATATAELTRVMHMSASEISQTLGNISMFGVKDVSAQRRIVEQLGASALVGGMTSGEMMAIAGQTAATGLGMGLAATTTMPLAASTTAMLRNLSQGGVVSRNVMAQGGGVQQIQQSIDNARMQFAGSNAGYFAMMGGGGTDFFSSMMGGIGQTGGTLGGILSMQANRIDNLSKLSADRLSQNYNNFLGTQLKYLGITDQTSQDAQNAVFAMTRGTMGDAAGLAFARANFSVEGRRTTERTRMLEIDAQDTFTNKNDYEQWWLNNSLRGRLESAKRSVAGIGASLYSGVRDFFNPGQANFGVGRFRTDLAAIQMGTAPDHVRMADIAAALSRPVGGANDIIEFNNSGSMSNTMWGLGTVAGGLGGMWAGAKIGGLIGTMAGGPVGTIAGIALGAALGGLGGKLLGEGGAFLGAGMGINPATQMMGASARQYRAVEDAYNSVAPNNQRAREVLDSGKLSNNALFMSMAQRTNMGPMSVQDSQAFETNVNRIANQTGESVSTIVSALKAQGVTGTMAASHRGLDASKKTMTDAMEKLLGHGIFQTTVNGGANFGLSSTAAALGDFLSAKGGQQLLTAQSALVAEGVDGEALAALKKNFSNMSGEERKALFDSIATIKGEGGTRQVNEMMKTATGYARALISTSDEPGGKAASAALDAVKDDQRGLLQLLDPANPKGKELRNVLKSSETFKEAMSIAGTSSDRLMRMSANQIAASFTDISADEANEAFKAAKGNKDVYRSMLEYDVLSKRTFQKNNEANDTDLNTAAMTKNIQALNGICDRLKISTAPEGGK